MQWKEDMNDLMTSLNNGPQFSDWHAHITIQFGELIESGFDWGENDYCPAFKGVQKVTDGNGEHTYNWDEHRKRLNKKIVERYYWREICATPPGKFKWFLLRKLNEIMPKYMKLYMLQDDKDFKILRQETYNSKDRNVFSEYPQSQLKGDNDYATNADDHAHGHTKDGAPVEMVIDYWQRYNDIDVMILDELDVCFMSLMTLNVNAGV